MRQFIAATAASALVLGFASHSIAGDRIGVPYRLPKTTPVVTAKVTLLTCGGNPTFAVDMQFSVRADLGPAYVFRADALSSWRVSRDFTLDVDADGRLAGVNVTSEDKTTTIVTNIFKGIVGLVKVAAGSAAATAAAKGPEQCTPEAVAALARVKVLKNALTQIRTTGWDTSKPTAELEAQQKQIDALSIELAALETSALTQDISVDGDMGPPGSAVVFPWPKERFGKWLVTPARPEGLDDIFLTTEVVEPTVLGAPTKPMKCDLSLAVPRPAFVNFSMNGKIVMQAAVQQWGEVENLCLDTGLFATRTVVVAYDDFGVMTKLVWKSNARGEAASAAFNDLVTQYAAWREARAEPSATQKANDAADLAEARARQIKAEQCLAKLQAGAACD